MNKRSTIIITAIILAGLALRLFVAWQDVTVLLVKTMPDDSFFVYRIAMEIANGNGLTFDGEIPSNSPRLIWELILAGVFKLGLPGDSLPVNIICTVSSLADTLTILLLYKIASLLFRDRKIAITAAVLYAFWPYAIMRMNNGLETALAIALFVLVFYLYIRAFLNPESSYRRYFVLGVISGLMILTRLDYALLPIALITHIVVARRDSVSLKIALSIIFGVVILTIPWMVWSYITFGAILPSSGYACSYIYYTEYLRFYEWNVFDILSQSWYFFYRALKFYAFPFLSISRAYFGPISFIVFIALAVYAWFKAKKSDRGLMVFTLIPVAIVLILLIVHGFIGWYAREWHSGPSYVATVLIAAFIIKTIRGIVKPLFQKWIYTVVIIGLVPLYVWFGFREWTANPYYVFLNHYNVSIWMRNNLPEDAIVGSFDGGIPGYFSHRRVIDLVGIENDRAFDARVNNRLGAYIDEAEIDFLHVMPVRISERYLYSYGEDIKDRLAGPLFYSDNDAGHAYWERVSAVYEVKALNETGLVGEGIPDFEWPPGYPGEDNTVLDIVK